jgi:hypothetical protein
MATRLGTKEEYLRYVAMAHANGLKRVADRGRVVMFVSNHDVDRSQAINRRKRRLPYAIMLGDGRAAERLLPRLFRRRRPGSAGHAARPCRRA